MATAKKGAKKAAGKKASPFAKKAGAAGKKANPFAKKSGKKK